MCVTRSRPLSLSDLQRALQSGAVLHEGLVFSGGVVDLEEDGDTLRLLPTAVRLLTERASHSDWMLRTAWLSSLAKSYKHAPGRELHSLLLFLCFFKSFMELCSRLSVVHVTLKDFSDIRFIVSEVALVQLEAGNRALKAMFSSKLTVKGKSLTELLQPHSTGRLNKLNSSTCTLYTDCTNNKNLPGYFRTPSNSFAQILHTITPIKTIPFHKLHS